MITNLLSRHLSSAGRAGLFRMAASLSVTGLIFTSNFASGILSARLLGPDGRGVLAIALSLTTFLATIFMFAGNDGIAYIEARGIDRVRRSDPFLGSALLLAVVTGALGAASIAALAILPGAVAHDAQRLILPTFVMLLPLSQIGMIITGHAQGKRQTYYWNILRLLPHFLYACAIIVLWLLKLVTPMTFAVGNLTANAATAIFGFYYIRKTSSSFSWGVSRRLFPIYISYLTKLYPSRFMQLLRMQADRVLVAFFLSVQSAGLYAGAVALPVALQALSLTIASSLQPEISAKLRKGSLTSHSLRVSLALIAGAMGAIFLVAISLFIAQRPIINLLLGPNFSASAPIMGWLALGAGFTSSIKFLELLCIPLGRVRIITHAELVGLAGFLISFAALRPTDPVDIAWYVMLTSAAGLLYAMVAVSQIIFRIKM